MRALRYELLNRVGHVAVTRGANGCEIASSFSITDDICVTFSCKARTLNKLVDILFFNLTNRMYCKLVDSAF